MHGYDDYHTYSLHQHLAREERMEWLQHQEDNEFERLDIALAALFTEHGFEDIYEKLIGTDLWINALTEKAKKNLNAI